VRRSRSSRSSIGADSAASFSRRAACRERASVTCRSGFFAVRIAASIASVHWNLNS
jgi:hypothetical protein